MGSSRERALRLGIEPRGHLPWPLSEEGTWESSRFAVTQVREGEGALARAGIRVDEVVPCAVSGTGEALDRLLAAVSSTGEYQAVQVAPDRLQFARTFRPTWAIVSGCVTVWLALVGVFFFFVKTTETCLAVIESDHRGTRIRLVGRLSSATLATIRTSLGSGRSDAATSGESIGHPVPTAFDVRPVGPAPVVGATVLDAPGRPPTFTGSLAEIQTPPTGAPSPLFSAAGDAEHDADSTVLHPRGATGRPSAGAPIALLDDGSQIELSANNLIGRDPVADGQPGPTQLLPIDDPTRSVSKTHLAVSFRDRSWWVTDMHSTNGVDLVWPDERVERLQPGTPTAVRAGVSVRFGERTLHLALGAQP